MYLHANASRTKTQSHSEKYRCGELSLLSVGAGKRGRQMSTTTEIDLPAIVEQQSDSEEQPFDVAGRIRRLDIERMSLELVDRWSVANILEDD